jgi:predicted transcriptional regulator
VNPSIATLRLTEAARYLILARMKIPSFTLRGFRRPSEAVYPSLGKLEREVLEETWRRGETSVRDLFLAYEERLAYTTLMTTFDRLYKKGLLQRRKDGRAFLYTARVSREELKRGIAEDVLSVLLGRGTEGVEPVLACIVDAVSERDYELLDELDRLVKEKRRELQHKD